MMKMKKALLCALAVFAAAVFASCESMADRYEEKIEKFVNDNISELEQIALDCIDGKIIDANFNGAKLDELFEGEHDIVQFNYGGFGIAPSASYYGFYYSPDDVAVPFQNTDNGEFNEVGEGKWEWTGDGDNGGIVTKIADNWYFYEAHF